MMKADIGPGYFRNVQLRMNEMMNAMTKANAMGMNGIGFPASSGVMYADTCIAAPPNPNTMAARSLWIMQVKLQYWECPSTPERPSPLGCNMNTYC